MPLNFTKQMNFRPKREERVDEFNFDGGYVSDKHETKLRLNESPDMYNVIFNETGSIKTRGGYTRYNGTPPLASSAETNMGASTGTLTIDALTDYVAQTYQVSSEYEILQVDLSLAMANANEEQYIRVELWDVSGGEPSSAIDSHSSKSQIKLISGTSETTYSFYFRVSTTNSASTDYAIVVKPYVVSGSTVNAVNVHHTGNDYANGSSFTSTNSGIDWTEDATKDLKFTVYEGGSTKANNLIRFYGASGIKQTLAKVGSNFYRGNDSTGTLTAITLGSGASFNADNHLDWTIVDNTLLVVDGENEIQKYKGSTNSNYSTGTISVTNGSATVTGSGTSWATTTNAEVGEYIQLPDGKWYEITAIGSDTSLTIEIEYQGTTASGESYTISPWGEIQGKLNSSSGPSALVTPTPDYIESHKDRVWTLKGNTLFFSTVIDSVTEEHFNDFDSANNSGQINIYKGQGGSGTGLYSLGNSLFVFQRKAIWQIYGNSPANFELRNVSNEIGLIDQRTLAEYNDVLVFLSDQGLYLFDGSNLKNISEDRVNTFIDTWSDKDEAVGVLWDNKYLLAHTNSGDTENHDILVYDFSRDIFGRFEEVHVGDWSKWSGGTDKDEVYFISSDQGSIYKWDDGTNDDGYEIKTFYATPSLGFNANVNDKTLKRFYIQQLSKGDYDMTVRLKTDVTGGGDTKDINLSGGTTSLWDVMEWDVDPWSSEGDIITSRIGEFQGTAKYFKFEFEEEGLDTGINILGMTITERERRLT